MMVIGMFSNERKERNARNFFMISVFVINAINRFNGVPGAHDMIKHITQFIWMIMQVQYTAVTFMCLCCTTISSGTTKVNCHAAAAPHIGLYRWWRITFMYRYIHKFVYTIYVPLLLVAIWCKIQHPVAANLSCGRTIVITLWPTGIVSYSYSIGTSLRSIIEERQTHHNVYKIKMCHSS